MDNPGVTDVPEGFSLPTSSPTCSSSLAWLHGGLTWVWSHALALVRGHVVRLELRVDGVVIEGSDHLLDGVVDEDEGDEGGEAFLGEARDVLDDEAGVRGDQDETLQAGVQTNPQPELHVVNIIAPVEHSMELERAADPQWCGPNSEDTRTYLLKSKSSFSKIRMGPVLLRMMRGCPAKKQKTEPAIAVPMKLSITP